MRINQLKQALGSPLNGVFRLTDITWHAGIKQQLYCRCQINDVTGSEVLYIRDLSDVDFSLLQGESSLAISANIEKHKDKLCLIAKELTPPPKPATLHLSFTVFFSKR